MNKQAEDYAFEKEIEYSRGLLDAIQLVQSDAYQICMKIPEQKRFDALMDAICFLDCEALEKHNENTRINLMHFWDAERWLKQAETTTQPQNSENPEPQGAAPVPLCPNGCGTKLEKRKFVDVFTLDMKPDPNAIEEDLYCPKCGTRWVHEQHVPLDAEKEAAKLESNSDKAACSPSS